MVAVDTTVLTLILNPGIESPEDDESQQIERVGDRINFLLATLDANREKIVIPTPALSEMLVRAQTAGPIYVARLNGSTRFRIASFDERAAIELAAWTREAIEQNDKKSGSKETWAKVKFDRQIVAITKVEGARLITNDRDCVAIANRHGVPVTRLRDLPLPPGPMPALPDPQTDMFDAGTTDAQEA